MVSIDGTPVESLGSAAEIERLLHDNNFPKTLVLRKPPPHVAADVTMLFDQKEDTATHASSSALHAGVGSDLTATTSERGAGAGPAYTSEELDKVATEAAVHVKVLRTIESHFAAGRISAEDRDTMLRKQREAARVAMAPLNGTPDTTSAKAPPASEGAAPERAHAHAHAQARAQAQAQAQAATKKNPRDNAELSRSIHKACQFACETLQAEVISKDMFQKTVDVLLKLQSPRECSDVEVSCAAIAIERVPLS